MPFCALPDIWALVLFGETKAIDDDEVSPLEELRQDHVRMPVSTVPARGALVPVASPTALRSSSGRSPSARPGSSRDRRTSSSTSLRPVERSTGTGRTQRHHPPDRYKGRVTFFNRFARAVSVQTDRLAKCRRAIVPEAEEQQHDLVELIAEVHGILKATRAAENGGRAPQWRRVWRRRTQSSPTPRGDCWLTLHRQRHQLRTEGHKHVYEQRKQRRAPTGSVPLSSPQCPRLQPAQLDHRLHRILQGLPVRLEQQAAEATGHGAEPPGTCWP